MKCPYEATMPFCEYPRCLPDPFCEQHADTGDRVAHDTGDRVAHALTLVNEELGRAMRGHPTFNSMHEGFAVIHEEFDELKTEVWKNPKKHPDRTALARKEAIQLAAMAIRFLVDVA